MLDEISVNNHMQQATNQISSSMRIRPAHHLHVSVMYTCP